MNAKHSLRRLLGFALVFLALYITATTTSIVLYQHVDETQPADVIIVLGAAASEDGVSPVFRERLNHGMQLYRDGYADTLLLTGGVGSGNVRSDAAIARDYLIQEGVPAEDILIEETSTITEENLKNAKIIMDEHALKTALLVSDPLHMKRSMLMARDLGIVAYSSPTPTSMYRSASTKLSFLAREEFFYVGYRWARLIRSGA